MAKYTVRFSCGHEEVIELRGKNSDRERKIKNFEEYGICSKCWEEQKNKEASVGCEEVEMLYKEYKTNYAECETKKGSYNGETKTIVVYVPK